MSDAIERSFLRYCEEQLAISVHNEFVWNHNQLLRTLAQLDGESNPQSVDELEELVIFYRCKLDECNHTASYLEKWWP
jgi:hypothetical protein